MDKFILEKKENKISSINRTIRFKEEQYDKLVEISETAGISFNKAVTQCIEFALNHYSE